MMQFNLNSIRVSKNSKSIEPEPTTNQPKSIGWDTIVNDLVFIVVGHRLFHFYWASKVKKDIEPSNIFLILTINIEIGNFEAENWIV